MYWLEDAGYPALIVPPTRRPVALRRRSRQAPAHALVAPARRRGGGPGHAGSEPANPHARVRPRVLLTAVLCSVDVECDKPLTEALCLGPECGRCLKTCPADAVREWDRDWEACDRYRSPHGFAQLCEYLARVIDEPDAAGRKPCCARGELQPLAEHPARRRRDHRMPALRRRLPVGADYAPMLKDAVEAIPRTRPRRARLAAMTKGDASPRTRREVHWVGRMNWRRRIHEGAPEFGDSLDQLGSVPEFRISDPPARADVEQPAVRADAVLLAAGLTLVFGIMDMINLAHGSLYMIGAYLMATFAEATRSFWMALPLALLATALVGAALEVSLLRKLYERDHLTQVLATFAVILIANELVRIIWGNQSLMLNPPSGLTGPVQLPGGVQYASYRLAIIAVGILCALLLYFLVTKTKVDDTGARGRLEPGDGGRDGCQHPASLHGGLRARRGALRAGRRDARAAPRGAGRHGREHPHPRLRGDRDQASARSAARSWARFSSGSSTPWGGALLPVAFARMFSPQVASNLGPSINSILIYVLMAAVLSLRPQGLFPARG